LGGCAGENEYGDTKGEVEGESRERVLSNHIERALPPARGK